MLLKAVCCLLQNGVAGSFWYSTAAVLNMILFPMLSVQFKTRAPGAKTFLQVTLPACSSSSAFSCLFLTPCLKLQAWFTTSFLHPLSLITL